MGTETMLSVLDRSPKTQKVHPRKSTGWPIRLVGSPLSEKQ